MTDSRAIKKMHENKMRKMSESQLGMQVGACLNKAVDIVIYNAGIESPKQYVGKEEITKWTDILFDIGRQKKIKEMEEPTKADIEDKQTEEHWQEGDDKPLPTITQDM